ncbi:DUF6544 family protein [Flagellimonas sp.]|uniref:DUF6544 family protein n=1 Tax=Flagellimonas sp. TaxID=2058762 RepID=UPI003F4A1731
MTFLTSQTSSFYILLFILFVFLLPGSIFYAYYRFNKRVNKQAEFLFNLSGNTEKLVSQEDLRHLPQIVRQYVLKVGVLGKCKDCHAIIKQSGNIRQEKNKRWMAFTAKQFMSAKPLGFVWAARSFPIFVMDKSIAGEGETNVSFLGYLSLASEHSPKTHQSALGRCLGELVLYPVGFLNKDISWEIIDETSVKATIVQNHTSIEGVFYFDENGLINRFVTSRYRGDSIEKFTGKIMGYEQKAGLLVPTELNATWNLKEGDFEYFNCKIIHYKVE